MVTWIPEKLTADPCKDGQGIQITGGVSEPFDQPIFRLHSVLLSEKEEAATVWYAIYGICFITIYLLVVEWGNPLLINPWEKKIYATKEGAAYQTILSRGWLRLCAKESVSTLDL